MSVGTPAITNFTAGEWSEKLMGRIDLARYGQACSELKNMTIMPHGAVTRRMGTEFVSTCASAAVRLLPFIFSEEQSYVLEFTEGKIRFFRSGGLLANKDIQSDYTATDISQLGYCQSADVMYLVCPAKAPRKLIRNGQDSFALVTVTFADAPAEWKEGNWPACVTFYQQRLWLAGTPEQPQKVWASKTGSFEDFKTGTEEDAALALSLVSEQVNAVRWIIPQKSLMGGTSGGEWALYAGNPGNSGAITNKTLESVRNSNYGSAAVRPLLVGASVFHVSADKRRLRDLGYTFSEDTFISNDVSLVAEHLTRPGIKELAYMQNPDSIVWVVMQNGSLAGITYLKEQEVGGWHRHESQGQILSVCCIPGQNYTQTWFAVKRQNAVCIERMHAPWDGVSTNDPACWYVDSGLLYEGAATTRIGGIQHLEGMEVEVLADGAAHKPLVVKNGAITLAAPATRVLVGLGYSWALAPMRLEGLSQRGTMQGKKTRVVDVMVRLYKSLGLCWERRGQSDPPYPLADRDVDMPLDAAPRPFTGDAVMTMPLGWDSDTRIRLSGRGAFPATVIMMVPKIAINE
ncbi:hypothetical protein LJC09_04220 [Desulfovibrio sp. OttesenSCG-928-F20]|nr:hypothetical protein [Desulfovibrio sp. OttesenSCG-928-F20]